jgi:hypothetical protein
MKVHHAVVGSSALVIMLGYAVASRGLLVVLNRSCSSARMCASSVASPSSAASLSLSSAYSEPSASSSWFARLFHSRSRSSTASSGSASPATPESVPSSTFVGPFIAAIDQVRILSCELSELEWK